MPTQASLIAGTRDPQPHIVRVLAAGQILAGLGLGATLSIGAILAVDVAGSDSWAGSAATLSTLGSALAAVPLARLAARRGRRPALALGAGTAAVGSIVALAAATIVSFPLLLVGFGLVGVGSAVGLQARFAATDLAGASNRGRDLSVVVWSTTVGAVVGPNLIVPGAWLAGLVSLTPLTGPFMIALVAQLAAVAVYLVGLRPDPLVLARERTLGEDDGLEPLRPDASRPDQRKLSETAGATTTVRFAIATLGVSHATMVAVMAMTPVHLVEHGANLSVVGFTISLHIAGMYGLSPLFGWASDRLGRIPVIIIGQLLFLLALVLIITGSGSTVVVGAGLTLLGLGWSATTVAASALVSDTAIGPSRVRTQGRSDLVLAGGGVIGGALAGPVLVLVGYPGLAASVGVLTLVALNVSVVMARRTVSLQPATLEGRSQ